MSSASTQIVVVGNVGIDTNVYLYGNDIDFTVEANFSQNLDYVGQAGGYTSRGYAQLGYPTAFIGNVGDDWHGRWIATTLAADNIDTAALMIDPAGTNRSVNFMYRDGRRKNFYDGRGNMDFEPNLDLCRQILSGATLAHFHLANWTRQLLPLAQEMGVVIACDLQDVADLNDLYREDYVNYADIIFCSAANFADPAPLIEAYLARDARKIIVIGRGAEGAVVAHQGGTHVMPPVDLELPPVIDTNGAGDGLAVGFLSSYVVEGYNLDEALERGQITARYTCTRQASSDGLISQAQLNHYFQQL